MDVSQPVGKSLKIDASTNIYYRSMVFYDVANPLSTQKGYATVGAKIGFGDIDDKWRVSAFARNLFDKRFHSAVIGLPFSDPGGAVNWLSREGRRTIGVSAETTF